MMRKNELEIIVYGPDVFKSWLMHNNRATKKNVSTVIFLVGGNNIKRTTASFQSAYRDESCSCALFLFGYFAQMLK